MSLTWSHPRPAQGVSSFPFAPATTGLTRVATVASRVAQWVLLAVVAVLAVGTVTLLGGGVKLATTHGTSMAPLVRTGDMAVVRSASTYHVGDIVAYHSSQLHTTVLHRITWTDGHNFVLKGDHNAVADSGVVTKPEIIGRASFVVHGGWPLVAKILVGAIGLLLGLMWLPDWIAR